MGKYFLFTVISLIIILIILILAKLGRFTRSRKIINGDEKTKNPIIKLRREPESFGSVVGQVISIYVIILGVSYIFDPKHALFLRLVSNPYFWALTACLISFYVLFPMGREIPVFLFRGINALAIIVLLVVVVVTTIRKDEETERIEKNVSSTSTDISTKHLWEIDPDIKPPNIAWISQSEFELELQPGEICSTNVIRPVGGNWNIINPSGNKFAFKTNGAWREETKKYIPLTATKKGQLVFRGGGTPIKLKIQLGV